MFIISSFLPGNLYHEGAMYTVLINQVAPVLFYAVLLLSVFMRIQNDITEPMFQVKSKAETKKCTESQAKCFTQFPREFIFTGISFHQSIKLTSSSWQSGCSSAANCSIVYWYKFAVTCQCTFNYSILNSPFFLSGLLSRTFTIHRTAGEGGGYLFDSSLPFHPLHSPLDISQAITA